MQQTTNLNLELYEATDNANLLDGYNSSMRKLDAHEGTQDGLITLAQSTANSASSTANAANATAAEANTRAAGAATAAGNAQTDATQALTDATQALTQLGGLHIEHIHQDDKGTKWTQQSWANSSCIFNGLVLYDEEDRHGILIASYKASSTGTTTGDAWQLHSVARLADWTVDTDEGGIVYGFCKVVNDAWGPANTISTIDNDGVIGWQGFNLPSTALPANQTVYGYVIEPVIRRS